MRGWQFVVPVAAVFAATGCMASKSDIRLLQDEIRTLRAMQGRADTARRSQADSALVLMNRTNDSLRVLALRFRTSHSFADDGKLVPFYLMETIGGAKDLRGYKEYRFRDTRNVLVSAEYRWEVAPFADMSVFFDAGKVFEDASDFDLDRLHTGYGVGLRVHTPPNFVLRMDVAHSREGFRFHISGGPSF